MFFSKKTKSLVQINHIVWFCSSAQESIATAKLIFFSLLFLIEVRNITKAFIRRQGFLFFT